jgi:hypothetical protein
VKGLPAYKSALKQLQSIRESFMTIQGDKVWS